MSLENRPFREGMIVIEVKSRPNRGHPPDGEGRRGMKDGKPFSMKRRPATLIARVTMPCPSRRPPPRR